MRCDAGEEQEKAKLDVVLVDVFGILKSERVSVNTGTVYEFVDAGDEVYELEQVRAVVQKMAVKVVAGIVVKSLIGNHVGSHFVICHLCMRNPGPHESVWMTV